MNLFKLLWCKIFGHKYSQENNIEEWCDGSITIQECCDRCGCLLKHYTHYDMSNETITYKDITKQR